MFMHTYSNSKSPASKTGSTKFEPLRCQTGRLITCHVNYTCATNYDYIRLFARNVLIEATVEIRIFFSCFSVNLVILKNGGTSVLFSHLIL